MYVPAPRAGLGGEVATPVAGSMLTGADVKTIGPAQAASGLGPMSWKVTVPVGFAPPGLTRVMGRLLRQLKLSPHFAAFPNSRTSSDTRPTRMSPWSRDSPA